MDISAVLENVDRMFNENRADEVEGLLIGAISVAMDEQDGPALLQLLNELIGFYRETSRYEDAFKIAEEIEAVAGQILPVESIPYATSLLNIATAYRAGGRCEDALNIYNRVEEIYKNLLGGEDMLMASLYNNESLLYQEMREFEKSKQCLEKALKIVISKGEKYEEAVSRANLAGTCMQLGELEEGYENAVASIDMFTEMDVTDGHFAAALSALGSYYYIKGEFENGAVVFKKAMEAMERSLGKNAFYARLEENYQACVSALGEGGFKKGLDVCRAYYEELGAPMLMTEFSGYLDRIAVGLIGEGSDCFGYDDEISRDHDWGPGFCIFVSDDVYDEIGEKLQQAYDALPDEFGGFKRAPEVQGAGRRGVVKVSDFCKRLLGTDCVNAKEIRCAIDWQGVSDAGLAAFVNGEIWYDPSGIITSLRYEVAQGYPDNIRYLKIAQSCAMFSQAGQYNYKRCNERGDKVTASIMKNDAMREAMKLCLYMENEFPPHDKWLYKALDNLESGEALKVALDMLAGKQSGMPEAGLAEFLTETSAKRDNGEDDAGMLLEKLGDYIAMSLYSRDIISDIDSYLDHHTEELLLKSRYSSMSVDALAEKIAEMEFRAFDRVHNEGGRASCQNDWYTFSIMRRSQYLTWDKTMLLQYIYDFERAMKQGHNLITEKYGRMMESTAPEKYAQIKDNFPVLSEEKKQIVEAVCEIQVGWMDAFAEDYPALAGNARSVHTYDDHAFNTSYETYLRGEISTYSDKMLELYARFIVSLSQEGQNLARLTMENSCRLYGYSGLDDAERRLSK